MTESNTPPVDPTPAPAAEAADASTTELDIAAALEAAPEEAKETLELKVTVEDAGPARKALNIEVAESEIQKATQEAYGKLQSDAVLPGFRKGRAPMRLLEKRFNKTLRDDVRSQLIGQAYSQVIEQEKLDVIGEPEFPKDTVVELPESGPMCFRIEVEVSPKVELPSLEGIAVKKTQPTIDDARIDQEIKRFRDQMGTMAKVTDAPAEVGDYLSGSVRIYAGENPAAEAEAVSEIAEAYTLINGEEHQFKGHIAGVVVPELGKLLQGKKAGETVDIAATGPAQFEVEAVRNQPITLRFANIAISRMTPATDDVLLQRVGMEDFAEFRTNVGERLTDQAKGEVQQNMRQQVADYLLQNTTLELPAGVSGRQAARLVQRAAMEMMSQGVSESEIQQRLAELRTQSEAQAQKQLKMFFVLDQAARDLKVDVAENEINSQIYHMAIRQGRRPEKLRQEMQKQGQIEQIYLQVRDQKTLDKILESAAVEEVQPDAPKADAPQADAPQA